MMLDDAEEGQLKGPIVVLAPVVFENTITPSTWDSTEHRSFHYRQSARCEVAGHVASCGRSSTWLSGVCSSLVVLSSRAEGSLALR